MNEFSQADLTGALSDYRAKVSEVMKVTTAWHEKLEAGGLPSREQIADFQKRTAELNAKAQHAWDHYCDVSASLSRL